MTGIDREQQDRRLRWAAAELGVRPDAPPEEVRAAFLRRLADEEFVPPPSWRWAVEALTRRGPDGPSEARADAEASRAEEERLREEVEAFTEQFWALAPAERGSSWQHLAARCGFSPPLRARLEQLRPGLDAGPAPRDGTEPPEVVELAAHIQDLFVLRPGPRARARREVLAGIRGRIAEGNSNPTNFAAWANRLDLIRVRIDEWQAAARRLRKRYRALAALETQLLEEVATLTWGQDRAPRLRPPRPREEQAGKRGWRPLGCNPVFVVVIVVLNLFRVLFSSGDRPRYDPPPPATAPRFGDDGRLLPGGEPTPFGISPESRERVRRLPPKGMTPEEIQKLIEELREAENARRRKAGDGLGSQQPRVAPPSLDPSAIPEPGGAGEKTPRSTTERRSP
jgi:hypothetical protein